MTFPYLKQKQELSGFYIDVPYEKNEDSIQYVAGQLRELKKYLEDMTGKKIAESAVQQAVANSKQSAEYYSRQLALRKDHDPVSTLTNGAVRDLYVPFVSRFKGVCNIYETAFGGCKKSTKRRGASYFMDAHDAIFAAAGQRGV